jgi:hypothetical protein
MAKLACSTKRYAKNSLSFFYLLYKISWVISHYVTQINICNLIVWVCGCQSKKSYVNANLNVMGVKTDSYNSEAPFNFKFDIDTLNALIVLNTNVLCLCFVVDESTFGSGG